MINFVDSRGNQYVFHHAWFVAGVGRLLPPAERGCYLILNSNKNDESEVHGTHTVLYAGCAKNFTVRIERHALFPKRFEELGLWGCRDNFEFLYMLEADFAGVRFSDDEIREFSSKLFRMEQRLKYLFVPKARCNEHKRALLGGLNDGKTNQVNLDLVAGHLEWAKRTIQNAA